MKFERFSKTLEKKEDFVIIILHRIKLRLIDIIFHVSNILITNFNEF